MIRLSVAVLVGGQSQRMGQDKAILRLRPDDPPLLRLVIDRVQPLTDDLVLIGPNRAEYDQFGVTIIPDAAPGIGPLAGIASALANAKYDACLIVACDMPFLNPALLAYMVSLPRTSYDALVPHIPASSAEPGQPLIFQTLHAIYQRSCVVPIQRHLAAGNRRVTDFYPDVRLRTLSASEARVYDPDLRSFVGVNTPEAVMLARTWLANSPGTM